jgi:putative DNA primase/helicase
VTLDDFSVVGRVALDNIDTLLAEWFPNGVRQGREFCIGSMDGEAGQSLRICLTGDKAGVWSDFSAGEAGSDLISLYAAMHGLRAGKACAALAERFGIAITPSDKTRPGASQAPLPAKAKTSDIRPPAQANNGVQAVSASKARTPWVPILPVPDDAGPYPKAHPVRGRLDASWEYHNEAGALLGVIYRFVTSDGGKEVLPCVFAEHAEWKKKEWRWLSFPEPRPLYLGGALRPELPLLVVEGEKCRDAAGPLLMDEMDVVSWPGGSKALKKADWSAIRNRDVILWPDADSKRYKEKHERAGELIDEKDQPGMKAMLEIAAILESQGNRIAIVDIPLPTVAIVAVDGWDVADLIAAGAGTDEVLAWVTKLRAAPADDVLPQDDDTDDGVPEWFDEHVTQQLDTISTERPASAGGLTQAQLRSKLIGTANGGIKGCRENVFTVMQNDARLIGLVGLDLFSGLQVKRRNAPWPGESGEWTESDDFHLGVYMAQHHSLLLAAIGDIERGVAQAAREHAFNPVIDYFDRCESMWDGKARVQNALGTYWGAGDSEYLQLVSTMFFVGIVVRGYRPGVKHDHAPVFEGGQGRGKSTALKVLGGEWFADTPFRMGEKDGYLSIQGVLLYEVAELEQFNRSEVTAIKAFMSSTIDRFREPYGRRMKNMPRRCAFAATTNENEYFKDNTGNRRFWPVASGNIDIDALIRDRDQLFGEAIHMLNSGVLWYPTRQQQEQLIDEHQESREITDPWAGRLYDYVEGIDEYGQRLAVPRRDKVTVRELLTRGLGFELSKLGPAKAETMRVSAIMKKLKWAKGRDASGARERWYARPLSVAADAVTEVADDLPI